MKLIASLVLPLLLGATAAFATSHQDAASAAKKDAFASGEVKKVDKAAGKLTIKHGPLVSLDMPAMTMVFRVKDPAVLGQVKAGDAIRFKAENVAGALTVTEVQKAK